MGTPKKVPLFQATGVPTWPGYPEITHIPIDHDFLSSLCKGNLDTPSSLAPFQPPASNTSRPSECLDALLLIRRAGAVSAVQRPPAAGGADDLGTCGDDPYKTSLVVSFKDLQGTSGFSPSFPTEHQQLRWQGNASNLLKPAVPWLHHHKTRARLLAVTSCCALHSCTPVQHYH